MAADNKEQILKDIDSLSLEKYIDEIAGAVVEGLSRCKTEKDVWGAVEVLIKMPNAMRRVVDDCSRSSPLCIAVFRRRLLLRLYLRCPWPSVHPHGRL